MFIIDDILFSPVRGILWIFEQIHHAVEEEAANEIQGIKEHLQELYMELETGMITESEFEAQETTLLDRLDEIQDREFEEPDPDRSDVDNLNR